MAEKYFILEGVGLGKMPHSHLGVHFKVRLKLNKVLLRSTRMVAGIFGSLHIFLQMRHSAKSKMLAANLRPQSPRRVEFTPSFVADCPQIWVRLPALWKISPGLASGLHSKHNLFFSRPMSLLAAPAWLHLQSDIWQYFKLFQVTYKLNVILDENTDFQSQLIFRFSMVKKESGFPQINKKYLLHSIFGKLA